MEISIVHILSPRFLEHSILDKEYLHVRHSDISTVVSYEGIANLELCKEIIITNRRQDPLEGLVKGFPMCLLRQGLIIKRRFCGGLKGITFHQHGLCILVDQKGKWIEFLVTCIWK